MKQMIATILFALAVVAQTPEYGAAANAIKALRSVTTSGVQYRQLSDRVLEARVKADQDPTLDPKLKLALKYYEISENAWNLRIAPRDPQNYARSVVIGNKLLSAEYQTCKPIQEMIASAGKKPSPSVVAQLLAQRPNLLWSCAAALIAETEAKP